MQVDRKFVKSIAKLSKIKLTDNEIGTMTPQMQTILDYAEKLSLVDTSKVEPKHIRRLKFSDLRDDEVTPSLPLKDVFANASDDMREGNFFKVSGSTFE